jgi:hypothetical protein
MDVARNLQGGTADSTPSRSQSRRDEKRGKQMSDMDPRTWSRQYQIALVLAIVIGMVLGGVVGLTASEIQPPAFIEYDTSISD